MKRGIICAACICALLACMAGYAARYGGLAGAMLRAGGSDISCFALLYGGRMDHAALERAQGLLGGDVALLRGGDGRVYGYVEAKDVWRCAALELRARGALGAWRYADRWVSARGASGLSAAARGCEAAIEMPEAYADAALDMTLRLLMQTGDRVRGSYASGRSASARGDRYHAAVRMGDDVIYMLAEGYLPIDY